MGGQRYTYSNITDVPPNLKPITSKSNDDTHVFFGQWDPLSSMHPCMFNIDGISFHSSEQYYQFRKALHCNELDLAAEILMCKHPMQCHRLTKRLKFRHSDNKDSCISWITTGNRAKFEQNEKLRDFLLQTDGKVIGEASIDPFLGIGLPLSDINVCSPENWPGENIFGKVLTDVRDIWRDL